jgi:hypothetical protein
MDTVADMSLKVDAFTEVVKAWGEQCAQELRELTDLMGDPRFDLFILCAEPSVIDALKKSGLVSTQTETRQVVLAWREFIAELEIGSRAGGVNK